VLDRAVAVGIWPAPVGEAEAVPQPEEEVRMEGVGALRLLRLDAATAVQRRDRKRKKKNETVQGIVRSMRFGGRVKRYKKSWLTETLLPLLLSIEL
jgi:hypothetical protein